MAIKLGMTSTQILEKVFPGVPRGYDPFTVDEFLDRVIKDYRLIEANALIDIKEIDNLNNQIEKLKKEKQELEIELGKYKERFSNIKESDNVTTDNIDLIKKINKYEKFLYSKGFKPDEIK